MARRLLPDALVGGGSREEREVPARPGSPAPDQQRQRRRLGAQGRSPGLRGAHGSAHRVEGAAGGDEPGDRCGRAGACAGSGSGSVPSARRDWSAPSRPLPRRLFGPFSLGLREAASPGIPPLPGLAKLERILPRNTVAGDRGERKSSSVWRSGRLLAPPPAAAFLALECPRHTVHSVDSTRDSRGAIPQSRGAHI